MDKMRHFLKPVDAQSICGKENRTFCLDATGRLCTPSLWWLYMEECEVVRKTEMKDENWKEKSSLES